MQAKKEHHEHWMVNSATEEVFSFFEILSMDGLGARGIKLKPNRVVTEKDVNTLVPRGKILSEKTKKNFINAHGKHIAELFRAPEQPYKEFYYPHYFINGEGTMPSNDLDDKFWKALVGIPGKSSHDGFQMAVIGRLDITWANLLLKIIKLILVMRYMPHCLKKISRIAIPKPKPNEYRPISLCHDIYCFVCGINVEKTAAAAEKLGILHPGITAYRKGKGCVSLIGI